MLPRRLRHPRLALLATLAAALSCGPTSPSPSPLTPFTFRSDGLALAAWVTPGPDAAPLLIVVHGGPGVSHEYTRPLARLATLGLRVAFWDQRGVGASTRVAPGAQTLAGQVRDLDALRRSLGADTVVLAGQSWGGLVALRYALDHPARVRALLLLDAVPASSDELQEAFARFHARRRAYVARGLVPAVLPPPRGDDCGPAQLALAPLYYHDPSHPLARSLGGSSCREGVLDATWRNIGEFDLRPALASLAPPALVLSGASDPFGPEMARDLAAALPATRRTVRELPRCGHNGFNECPEPYFDAITRFLSEHASPPVTR